MRLLDTHEQKSALFLFDEINELVGKELEVADYHTGPTLYEGSRVEYKDGKDFSIKSTGNMDRIRDEFYRMRLFQKQHPKIKLHAIHRETGIWTNPYIIKRDGTRINQIRAFFKLCFKYNIWGHIVSTNKEVVRILKDLDKKSCYIRDECFIKRDHNKITKRAKRFRVEPRISSAKAVELDKRLTEEGIISPAQMFIEQKVCWDVKEIIYDVLGRLKNGEPNKLSKDFIRYLEEGA